MTIGTPLLNVRVTCVSPFAAVPHLYTAAGFPPVAYVNVISVVNAAEQLVVAFGALTLDALWTSFAR